MAAPARPAPRRRTIASCLGLLLLVGAPGRPAAAAVLGALPDVPLAAHRATYDLSLNRVQGGDTVAASGSLSYQIGDSCTSWTTQQELRLHTVTRDGQAVDLVSDYATLEGKDGRHLAFDMKQRTNGQVAQQLRGDASMDPSGGRIRYTLPHPTLLPLAAGTLFPMAHTAAIIHAARSGSKSIAPALFDGTGPDGAQDTYVTILGWRAPPSTSTEPVLARLGSSQVHVAFFSRTPGTITPDYESAMRYFDNGVADQLLMDFGGFTMRGTLRSLVLPKQPRC